MNNIKEQFPLLQDQKNLVYLDSAATTQKPQIVLDTLNNFYTNSNANIHRGVYKLSQKSTDLYEQARATVAEFLHAESASEIIFTKGATEAINLVAHTFGEQTIQAGDEILITEMEHHANFVPWQQLAQKKQAILKMIPVLPNGDLDLSKIDSLLSTKTKIVALVHISNSLGTINPVKELIQRAHEYGASVLIDGCQAVMHTQVDVQDLDADFYVFSGHKLYGPTGVGVLYGKQTLLNNMPPYQYGGDMIEQVSIEKTTFQQAPMKFEAGTPPIAQAIALGTAINFIQSIGVNTIKEHESGLLEYAKTILKDIPGIRLITPTNQASILSFTIDGIHPHDIGTILDEKNIAVRTGHHCTQPVMKKLGLPATTRASFAIYNSKEDLDRLANALQQVVKLFA